MHARTQIQTHTHTPYKHPLPFLIQNAHAYVNAGFSAEVDFANKFTVKGSPTLVFGGIESHAVSL